MYSLLTLQNILEGYFISYNLIILTFSEPVGKTIEVFKFLTSNKYLF